MRWTTSLLISLTLAVPALAGGQNVHTGERNEPVVGAQVIPLWGAAAADPGSVTSGDHARTDVDGGVTICGVPKGVAYLLVLKHSEAVVQMPPATFPQDGVLQLYLRLTIR